MFGLGPLSIPLPLPPEMIERRGQHDIVIGVVAGLAHAYSRSGDVRGAYDYVDVDSSFCELTAHSQRLSASVAQALTAALTGQIEK